VIEGKLAVAMSTRRCFGWVVVLVVLGARLAGAAEETPVAQVTWVKGHVTVHRVGQQAPEPIEKTAKLFRGDVVLATPGADAGLLIGASTRNLAALPESRWIASDTFDAPAKIAPADTSRPGGVDFAKAKVREQVQREGLLALIGGGKEGLGSVLGGGGAGSGGTGQGVGTIGPIGHRSGTGEGFGLGAGRRAAARKTAEQEGRVVVRPLRGKVAGKITFDAGGPDAPRAMTVTVRFENATVVERKVTGSRVVLPAGALSPGRTYIWTIEAAGGPVWEGEIEVVSEADRKNAEGKSRSKWARARKLEESGFADAALELYRAAGSRANDAIEALIGKAAPRRRE
jgi:hypothetical protein